MGTAISSRGAEVSTRSMSIARLQRDLAARGNASIPLLVIRLPALERTAWREGLRKARNLERRARAAFIAAATRTLRAEDTLAHDPGSDVFLAALTAPTRAAGSVLSVDARSALARICASMESATGLDVDAGWTTTADQDAADMAEAVRRGLARGAQERERYAFFSALGHELRTPLASIRGYLETLLDDEGIDESTRSRFLTIAYKESLRLSRLVEGMFEISLLDLHTTPTAHAFAVLESALDAAVDACAASAGARSIVITRSTPSRTVVAMDSDRLTLVLINLIENAIKHGKRGGRVAVGAGLPDEHFACVTIDDDGMGVAGADRERIFSLGARGTTLAPGNGIGLALVRLMLERAGGRVDVSDSPLGGARLRVHVRRQ